MDEEVTRPPWWRQRAVWLRVARDGISLALAVVLLVWGLPKVAGVGWTEIVAPFRGVHPGALALLALMQLSALVAVTFTITGSLPGITHTKALIVNLAGSLVANTLPFGGAVAIGATYGMCRSWGFSRGAIGISIVLGGVFSTAGKVLLPLLGLTGLILQGGQISPALRNAALVGVLTLVAVLVVFVMVMVSSRVAHAVGRALQGVAQWLLRLIRRPRELGWEAGVARLRDQTRDVMRTGWLSMTLGTLGYLAIYFLLFCVCLRFCGLVTGLGTLIGAFALGRLLTSVAVTPGGIGLVEAGSVALLVAMGADPAQAASGILLFTIFTHILEIPFGVLAWLAWLWGRGRTAKATGAEDRTRPVGGIMDDAAAVTVSSPARPEDDRAGPDDPAAGRAP